MTHRVGIGIITSGLGGKADNMIIGFFNLGFEFDVSIPPSHGGNITTGKIPQGKRTVIITVKTKNRKWQKTYIYKDETVNIIIKVQNIINTIRSDISVRISNFRKLLSKVRIKRK